MSNQSIDNITFIHKHVFGNQIYESKSKVISESIIEDNQVVTKRDLSLYWNVTNKDSKTILTTEFPIAATEQSTWSDFWNRYVIYTSRTMSGTKEESITLTASDFVYVNYLGPTNNKKVYACSPTKGLYTLTPTGLTITADQVLAQGCVHVNYSTNQDRFIICSDNRTTLGTNSALIIWDGYNNANVIQRLSYSTNAPFNISAYGILYYSSGAPIYGFYLGAATYNGEHNKTGFGTFYIYENDLQNTSITINRNTGYSYLNGDGDTETPDSSQYDSNRYVSADIKCISFTNPSNSVWVIACGGNTCGTFSNWGEDVLISQVGDNSVGKLYRFRFRNQNKQKTAKILFSPNSTWKHNGTTGTGIGIICCYDTNIPVYWFPSDFHPESEKSVIYSSSSFMIPSCSLGSGATNNQWLSCIDVNNYVIIGGSSKICYMALTQDNAASNPDPNYMKRTLAEVPNNPYSSSYGNYLDMTAFNGDVYVCANGAVIRIIGLETTSNISTLTNDDYEVTEIKDDSSESIQLVSATNDGEYIYAVGTSSGDGQAVIIRPDSGSGGLIVDSIITTSEFSKLNNCPTVHGWYSTLGRCLTTIKNNKETNPSGIVPGSSPSTTWLQAYNTLMTSSDVDIINFLNGTDTTFANCGPD